jgi:putative membrane protein
MNARQHEKLLKNIGAGSQLSCLYITPASENISAVFEQDEESSKQKNPQKLTMLLLAVRSAIGGTLMGLANLVPGISGGTMLLASGIYPDFINSVAEVTTLRFRPRRVLVLVCVIGAAALAILLWAGPIKDLVVNQRWIMYSIFIGLTLGGVPIVWHRVDRHGRTLWIGIACGFLAMTAISIMQLNGYSTQSGGSAEYIMLLVAGIAGASAMILPGISGGYLLLVLGQYVPILSAVDRFKVALEAGDAQAAADVALGVGLPVGLGVCAGVVGASNLLRILLKRYRTPTLGVLLGLLLGAVIGLWPFQQGVRPLIGEIVKGQTMTAESLPMLEPEDYPTEYFKPRGSQIGAAVILLLAGIATTAAISRLSREQS